MKNLRISTKLTLSTTLITPFSSKILYADDDGDGIPNKDDPYPNKKFDERFEIVQDYNISPKKLIPSNLVKRMSELDADYNTKKINILEKKLYLPTLYASFLARYDIVVPMFIDEYARKMPNSSKLLNHFLFNSGKILYIDNIDEMIACTKYGYEAYTTQLNDMLSVAEEVLSNDQEIILASTDDNNYNINLYQYTNGMEFDWCYSFGVASTRMISKTKCKDDLYTMNVRYLVIDIYDWDKNEEKTLYNMHACGLARSYYAIGEYETSFSWKKGQRFTNPYISNDITEPEKLFNSKVDIYLDTVYKQTKLKYPEMFINIGDE